MTKPPNVTHVRTHTFSLIVAPIAQTFPREAIAFAIGNAVIFLSSILNPFGAACLQTSVIVTGMPCMPFSARTIASTHSIWLTSPFFALAGRHFPGMPTRSQSEVAWNVVMAGFVFVSHRCSVSVARRVFHKNANDAEAFVRFPSISMHFFTVFVPSTTRAALLAWRENEGGAGALKVILCGIGILVYPMMVISVAIFTLRTTCALWRPVPRHEMIVASVFFAPRGHWWPREIVRASGWAFEGYTRADHTTHVGILVVFILVGIAVSIPEIPCGATLVGIATSLDLLAVFFVVRQPDRLRGLSWFKAFTFAAMSAVPWWALWGAPGPPLVVLSLPGVAILLEGVARAYAHWTNHNNTRTEEVEANVRTTENTTMEPLFHEDLTPGESVEMVETPKVEKEDEPINARVNPLINVVDMSRQHSLRDHVQRNMMPGIRTQLFQAQTAPSPPTLRSMVEDEVTPPPQQRPPVPSFFPKGKKTFEL